MKRFSIFYAIAQAYLWVWFRVYYRRVRIVREAKIRNRGPELFTPNHQNALMDPMAIICSAPHQPYFLARADIFKNPYIAKFLKRIKLLPVYRMRDGADSLSKNQEVFEKTVDIFKNHAVLGVFPEANHAPFKRLRNLKKGVPRIAFIAENTENFELNLNIVPVGINYSEYEHANANLFIHYGNPIPVSQFKEAYLSNQVVAQNKLRDAIKDELKKLIVDIENEEDYDFIDTFQSYFRMHFIRKTNAGFALIKDHKASQKLVSLLQKLSRDSEKKYQTLKQDCTQFFKAMEGRGIKASDFYNFEMIRRHHFLFHLSEIVLAPLALPALIIFGIPHFTLKYFLDKKVKDRTFYSTFYFAAGWILFSVWLLMVSILVGTIFHSVWIGLVFYFASVIFGKFSFRWYGRYLRLKSYFKVRRVLKSNPELKQKLRELIQTHLDPLLG